MRIQQPPTRKRFAATVCVASIATVCLIALGVLLEYQYSKHFFVVNNVWWYQFRARLLFWEDLSFAFFLNYRETESTTLLACLLGISGFLTWRCVIAGRFARGVGLAMVATMTMCFFASFWMRQATFPELLALATVQMAVVITCCAYFRWSEPLRFGVRDLFVMSMLMAVYLVVPGLVDKHGNIGSIIVLDSPLVGLPNIRINSFLLMIGLVAGITTVAFLSNSKINPEFRAAYLVAVTFATGVVGACTAWMFEVWPTMQTGRGNLAAVNFNAISFRYGYTVLFPLSGLVSVAMVSVTTRRQHVWQTSHESTQNNGLDADASRVSLEKVDEHLSRPA